MAHPYGHRWWTNRMETRIEGWDCSVYGWPRSLSGMVRQGAMWFSYRFIGVLPLACAGCGQDITKCSQSARHTFRYRPDDFCRTHATRTHTLACRHGRWKIPFLGQRKGATCGDTWNCDELKSRATWEPMQAHMRPNRPPMFLREHEWLRS